MLSAMKASLMDAISISDAVSDGKLDKAALAEDRTVLADAQVYHERRRPRAVRRLSGYSKSDIGGIGGKR